VEELEPVWVCCGWRTPTTAKYLVLHSIYNHSTKELIVPYPVEKKSLNN
jgi:hypothetical protein